MSRLSLDGGNDLSQSFGLRWAQTAPLLVFRKKKCQMNSSRVRQIKIDYRRLPLFPRPAFMPKPIDLAAVATGRLAELSGFTLGHLRKRIQP